MLAIVLVLAGCFGFLAADRWLAMPRSVLAELDEHVVVLCTVSAIAALTVHLALP
jgi:hypothetical protein